MFRAALKSLLLKHYPLALIEEAGNAREILASITRSEWDVLLMDIGMPGRSGVDVIPDIKLIRPQLPILILTGQDAAQYQNRLFKLGASGLISKTSGFAEFFLAIEKVLAGQLYVSSRQAEQLVARLSDKTTQPLHESLSTRELEVFCAIARGSSLTEIGSDLSLSVKTISTYKTRIMEKMHLNSTTAIVRYALDNHLLS